MQHSIRARVAAVLTRVPARAGGDANHMLEMFVDLSPGAQLRMITSAEPPYRARRLVNGRLVWSGRLVQERQKWLLSSDDDDDPLCFARFGPLRPGEYITLSATGAAPLVFRVVSVGYPTIARPRMLIADA